MKVYLFLRLNLYDKLDKRSPGKAERVEVVTVVERRLKRSSLFKVKMVTPSVTAPCHINLSDATAMQLRMTDRRQAAVKIRRRRRWRRIRALRLGCLNEIEADICVGKWASC